MINMDIPGYKKFSFENIVFDYNGTVAVDGKLDQSTRMQLENLSNMLNVYILTADTYGNVVKECEGLNVVVKTFPNNEAARYKKAIVQSLPGECICVGNGFNDIGMFDVADLSIAIIGHEGCSGKLLRNSDVVVGNREDLFQLLLNTDRIRATLRG